MFLSYCVFLTKKYFASLLLNKVGVGRVRESNGGKRDNCNWTTKKRKKGEKVSNDFACSLQSAASPSVTIPVDIEEEIQVVV